jgi:hypothetical protein
MPHRLFRRRAERAPAADAFATAVRLENRAPKEPYTSADRARDFRAVFRDTPAGCRVLAQVLARCRVLARSHVPGDALETARREGMRDIGLWLLEMTGEDVADGRAATAEDEPGAERRSR